MHILLVEDDPKVAEFIMKGLREEGHSVAHAADGHQGLIDATAHDYDVLIVDRMLPAMDGLKLIKTLRATDDLTPVLVLSALGEVEQRVEGLKVGGDDYLAKPFAFSELLARLEALHRRHQHKHENAKHLAVADLQLDIVSHKVQRNGQSIDLQHREFRLLEFLMRHADQVVSRTMLLEHVWDYHFDPQTNVVDVHISRLRQKVDKGFATPLIHTVRGAGYRLGIHK